MQKWEYTSMDIKTIQQANNLGAQGWELVTIVRDDDSNTSRWIFKRLKS